MALHPQTKAEADNLERDRLAHKGRRFLRAWFDGKLTRRCRPRIDGYATRR